MKSKHYKLSNDSERRNKQEKSKFEKLEKVQEKNHRYYRTHSRSNSPRHTDTKKSNNGNIIF